MDYSYFGNLHNICLVVFLDRIVTAPIVDEVPDLETVRNAVLENGLL